MMGDTKKIKSAIEELKQSDLIGCITGSCLLDADFDDWETKPDIDIFLYNQASLAYACSEIVWHMGYRPGKGDEKTRKMEEWKFRKLKQGQYSSKIPVNTHSFEKDGVIVNLTYKKNMRNMLHILGSFDMDLVMHGFDIELKQEMNFVPKDAKVAHINPYRKIRYDLWDTAHWLRQWDRVVKYWNRGYDTRPVAEAYLDMVDKTMETANIFSTPAAMEAQEQFFKEFEDTRKKIVEWLEANED